MSITDELREWAEDNTLQDMVLTTYPPQHAVHGVLETLLRIADRIDAAHERAMADAYLSGTPTDEKLAELGWVHLPVDADGEVWHVGDLAVGKVNPRNPKKVERMLWYGPDSGWQLETDTIIFPCPERVRHYHAPTVEDVLREFAQEMNENLGMYTGEAIDADEWRDADNKTIAEYAKRLRLAGEDE